MAKTPWKGSILDTYEKNTTFGGRSGESAKDADKQAVDFIHTIVDGIEAVGGFTPHMTKDKSDMNVSDRILNSVRNHSPEKSTYTIGKKYTEIVSPK
jgi:hypothetical protein